LPSSAVRRQAFSPIAGLLALVTAAALLSSCSGSSRQAARPPAAPTSPVARPSVPCTTVLSKAPSCTLLWGTSADGVPVTDLERAIGYRLQIVYSFHGVDTGPLPTPQERAQARDGHILHIDLESRRFARAGHPAVRWSQVADGTFDRELRQSALGLAKLDQPFFVTFDHEADTPTKGRERGTAPEFVAAWRHVHALFAESGATKAIWAWTVTGYPANFARAARLYPGNDDVDWVSWDPYDTRGCLADGVGTEAAQTFEDVARPFYDWLQTAGVKAGISLAKPYLIGETGSAYDPKDPGASAAFYRSIPAGLTRLPGIRAVTLWDERASACDYRIAGVPEAESALRAAARATGQIRVYP